MLDPTRTVSRPYPWCRIIAALALLGIGGLPPLVAKALPGLIQVSNLAGTDGFVLQGYLPDGLVGRHVGRAGDVNGDGYDGMVVTAYGRPEAYVVYGAPSFPATVSLGGLDADDGFRILGGCFDADGAGDVNGDGYDDVICGHLGASVIYGGPHLPAVIDQAALGAYGMHIKAINDSDQAGVAVSGAGDVNGDGFDDVVLGANFASPNGWNSGQA